MKNKNKKPTPPKKTKEQIKQEKLEKQEQLQREKEIKENLTNKPPERQEVMTWVYSGGADITIGETIISNTAKKILLVLILLLLLLGAVGYYFRDYVLDYIINPRVILTDTEVDIEVFSEFDYMDYVAPGVNLDKYEVIYPSNDSVDTEKLGTYTLEYKVINSADENITTLNVNVVDTEPPKLTLTKEHMSIQRGEDTEKFDASKYIKSVSDNYDKEKDIKVEYTEHIDWQQDEVEVLYIARDKSGNEDSKKLFITVTEPPKVEKPDNEAQQQEMASQQTTQTLEIVYVPTPVEQPTHSEPQTSTAQESTSTPSPTVQPAEQQAVEQPTQSGPYINGVHDITVTTGTDFSTLATMLTSGVEGSGYVNVDFSSINLTQPGSYYATFTCDGITQTATVTVVE